MNEATPQKTQMASDPGSFVWGYCPVGSLEVARELAKGLVEGALAACVNVHGPHLSVYKWKGEIAEVQEWTLFIKTLRTRQAAVESYLGLHHPYETPALFWMGVEAVNQPFLSWVQEETGQS